MPIPDVNKLWAKLDETDESHKRASQVKTQLDAKSGAGLFYLDNLRIYLTVLVILHHASIAYGGAGDWE